MNFILDLTKMSPKNRREICETVRVIAQRQEREILNDLELYGEGRAKNDMMSWARASNDVYESAQTILQEREIVEVPA